MRLLAAVARAWSRDRNLRLLAGVVTDFLDTGPVRDLSIGVRVSIARLPMLLTERDPRAVCLAHDLPLSVCSL